MEKDQVAGILADVAMLLELRGENPFKTRAYLNAGRAIEDAQEPIATLVREGRLGELKGVGEAIQQKVAELVTTGRMAYYEELKASVPEGLRRMLEIPGLGTKKVKAIYDQLGIDSVEALEAACREGRLAQLRGFGEKIQANIRAGILRRREYAMKRLLFSAMTLAEPLLELLREHPAINQCAIAGSVRRRMEIVGNVDLVVSSKRAGEVIEDFIKLPGVESVPARDNDGATVLMGGGLPVVLRVVRDAEFPFALAWHTGSREHNLKMRERAERLGLRLDATGLYRSDGQAVTCQTEEDLYRELGLAFVPPELREGEGELEAAERQAVPRLVDWRDLKGSLHNHTVWSDGHNRMEEIAQYMQELGVAYWGITDHSKSSWQARGLDAGRLSEQVREVREMNRRLEDAGCEFRFLTGVEVDILAEGRLDHPDEVLAELDVVVASVHQRLSNTEAETTARIIKAIENPYVNILGHLTGRLLLEREPYAVDQKAVIDACAANGTFIELNASPSRLDMDWRLWPYAKNKGVRCVINCDAHANEQVAYLRLGAAVARKGWLEKRDVINCLPYPQLIEALWAKRRTLGKA